MRTSRPYYTEGEEFIFKLKKKLFTIFFKTVLLKISKFLPKSTCTGVSFFFKPANLLKGDSNHGDIILDTAHLNSSFIATIIPTFIITPVFLNEKDKIL